MARAVEDAAEALKLLLDEIDGDPDERKTTTTIERCRYLCLEWPCAAV
jgi:hypothetical protein